MIAFREHQMEVAGQHWLPAAMRERESEPQFALLEMCLMPKWFDNENFGRRLHKRERTPVVWSVVVCVFIGL